MADNYIEYSEVIPNLTDAEIAWLQEQLQPVVVVDGQEHPAGSLPDDVQEDQATVSSSWRGPRFLLGCDDETCVSDEPEFAYEFRLDDTNGKWGRYLWIRSEYGGNFDQIAQLAQKFLRQSRPRDCWTLTYAATCSKPRVGEFGGGAIIVTVDEIRFVDAQSIAEDAHRAWQAKAGSST